MSSKLKLRGSPAHSAAIAVRLVAFAVAAAAVIAIPSAMIATATGLVSHQSALFGMAGAAALIVVAALMVRPFDPL